MSKKSKKDKRGTLRTTIAVVFTIAFIILTVFLQVAVTSTLSSRLNDYAATQVAAKYDTFYQDLQARQKRLYTSVRLLTEIDQLQTALQSSDPHDLRYFLNAFMSTTDATDIYLLDMSNTITYTTDQDSPKTIFQNNATVKKAHDRFPLYSLALLNNTLNSIAVSRLTVPGVFDGFVVLRDDLTAENAINHYTKLLDSDFTIFIDDERIATSRRNAAGVRDVHSRLNNQEILDTIYKKNEAAYGIVQFDGVNYESVYERVQLDDPQAKAAFYIGMPKKDLDLTTRSVATTVIITILVSAIAFVVIMILIFTVRIINPISKAADAVHALAEDTDADLTFRTKIRANNEIGALCEDLDNFLERQQNMVIDLKSAQSALTTIGDNLGSTSEETASAITQIAANINGVKKQAENQSAISSESADKMQIAADKVTSLDTMIENQSAGIVESSAAIEEMIGNIGSVSNSVGKMSSQFKELIAVTTEGQQKQADVDVKVTQMAEQSRTLMEANSVIARIASQTNLLAMNAAIEAAHDGEAGAGFSVVADEIRSLAENSSKQSRNISQELKTISKTITEVVTQSAESRAAFTTITDKLSDTDALMQEIGFAMNEQNSASVQVLEALKDVTTSTANVRTTAKEVKDLTSNAHDQVMTLNNMAQMVMGSVEEMSSGTSQISQGASQVSELANETRENIQGMDDLIGRFKV